MTVAGQPTLTYAFDNAHRLISLTQGTSVVSFTYDDADRRSTLTLPNGIVGTYGYDDANELTTLTYTLGSSTLGTLTYSYDLNGNPTSVGGSWARTALPEAANATYDAANRIQTWAGQIFSYDANGNLASDGLKSYTWNARNQLVGVSGATSAAFAYDGLGRRRSKTIGGTTTNFLYDGVNLVQELSGGTPTANLLAGGRIDETVTRTDASGTSTLLSDALGSTLELAGASGAPQTHYTFEPFGATATSGAPSANAQQFAGRENDEIGLYFYRARYLNPSIGRFMSEDPIGFRGNQVNLYSYSGNGPVNRRDPAGQSWSQIHIAETYAAALAAGYSEGMAESLAMGVAAVDIGTQGTDPPSAHKHAMGGMKPGRKGGGESEGCSEAYDGAVNSLRDALNRVTS